MDKRFTQYVGSIWIDTTDNDYRTYYYAGINHDGMFIYSPDRSKAAPSPMDQLVDLDRKIMGCESTNALMGYEKKRGVLLGLIAKCEVCGQIKYTSECICEVASDHY